MSHLVEPWALTLVIVATVAWLVYMLLREMGAAKYTVLISVLVGIVVAVFAWVLEHS